MNSWIVISQLQINAEILDTVFQDFTAMHVEHTAAYYLLDGRFSDDQQFECAEDEITILDGVILNLSELKLKYNAANISDVTKTIKKNKKTYFDEYIGPFCGVHYDRKANAFLAFANQTGDAPLFYYHENGLFAVSNDFNLIIRTLKAMKIEYAFDETAALYIMSFGYMIDDRTYVKEIKRLLPGKYLLVNKDGLSIDTYYYLSYQSVDMTMDEAVEKVDEGFRLAVKRCFEKDMEYGCTRHLADASGGLDSRMVNWVAKDMGYTDIYNISYSQSNTDEQKFASKVSAYLGNTFLHEQLDDASFIFDLEKIVDMEYGLAPYFGITGGYRLLSSINTSCFGLEHTGQVGDAIIGTFLEKTLPVKTRYKRYSDLLDIDVPAEVEAEYSDLEEFLLKTRGFIGMLATHLIRRHYVYAVSPFLDPEFLSLCMSIPPEIKRGHRLYWEWIDRKYPEAGKLESTRERPRGKISSFSKRARGKLSRETRKALHSLGLSKSKVRTNNMNPFQYWFDTNPKISSFVDSYYRANKHLLEAYPDTSAAADKMMNTSNDPDKLLVLTVLATVKRYFGDEANERTVD